VESGIQTRESSRTGARAPGKAMRWRTERRGTVRVASEFEASPERLFDAWLDPGIAGQWLFATALRPMIRVAIDARVGGAFRFVGADDGGQVEHAGVYVVIDRPRRLVFTLCGEKRPRDVTRVSVEFAPLDSGCELTLVHENVPQDHAIRTENRWTGMLYGLGKTVATQASPPQPARSGAGALGPVPGHRRAGALGGDWD